MISNSGTTSLGLYDFKRQIDAFGGVDYFRPTLAGGYLPNARVMLSNGDIVQNDTNGNLTNDPNVDMVGWALTSPKYGYLTNTQKDLTSDLNSLLGSYDLVVIPYSEHPYTLSDNILIGENKTLIIESEVVQVTSGRELATSAKIISDYPLFRLSSNAKIETRGAGKIWSYYEAVAIEGVANNGVMSISNPSIDVVCECISVNDGYGQFSGISTYATNNLNLGNSISIGYGKKPTWDATENKMNYGGYHGFNIYLSNGVSGNITALRNGGNGVSTFACSDHNLNIESHYNGTSGFQLYPNNNSWVKCNGLIKVHATNNYADGFDIRWTGSGVVPLNGLTIQTICENNGYFENDQSRPTQDGSGIATIAFVSDVNILPSTSKNSAGSGLYLQGCSNVKTVGKCVATVGTNKEGLFLGNGCSDINVDVEATTKSGVALSFAGSQILDNIYISGSFKSESGQGCIVASGSTYNNVNVNAIITSGRSEDDFLPERINWTGSTFIKPNGGNITFNTANAILRETSGIASSGSFIFSASTYYDLSGVNYYSASGTAISLSNNAVAKISGNISSDSGTALSLSGASTIATLENIKISSNTGVAITSPYSPLNILNNVTVTGTQDVGGGYSWNLGLRRVVNNTAVIPSIAAQEVYSTTFNSFGVPVNSVISVTLSAGAKGCVVNAECLTSGVITLTITNPTSAAINIGNTSVKFNVFQ